MNSYKIEYYFTDYVMADSPELALIESQNKVSNELPIEEIKLYRIQPINKKDLH